MTRPVDFVDLTNSLDTDESLPEYQDLPEHDEVLIGIRRKLEISDRPNQKNQTDQTTREKEYSK